MNDINEEVNNEEIMEEQKRALAYITTVDEIRPIPNYDRVEHVRTKGWWCICPIGQFHVGDKAVYFEIDSLVPAKDARFAFLESKHYKIKTIKMCKVYSQGLLMPLSEFPELAEKPVGYDCTDDLGVTYYVPEDNVRKSNAPDPNAKYISMAARHRNLAKMKWFRWLMKRDWGKKLLYVFFGKKKKDARGWPSFIRKTDEQRCLAGDTKIMTNVGRKRIANIVNQKLDVLVKSYNFETNQFEYKKILDYQKFAPEPIIRIKYLKKAGTNSSLTSANSQSIFCSKDHRIYTEKGYKRASDITLDDKMMIIDETITDEAIPALYGMLIGDGCLTFDAGFSARITFTAGEKQHDYLKEKLRLLNCSDVKFQKWKSGYCDNATYAATTKTYQSLYRFLIKDNAIVNGKLLRTKEFCDRLTPMSLAFWYLDDGTIRHKDDGLSPTIEFSTYSETEEEVKNLMRRLLDFGIESVRYSGYRKSEFIGYTIRLNADDTYHFLDLIKNYIPYCMRWKTIPKFENVPYYPENTVYKNKEFLFPTPIIDITEAKSESLYDITVEDNHNFVANNVIHHNCELMPWVVEDAQNNHTKYSVSEKLDGTSVSFGVKLNKKHKYDFYVCSRNVLQKNENQKCWHDNNIYWEMAYKYDVEKKLTHFAAINGYDTVVLQGEGIGKVQGNPYKLEENDLYCFNLVLNGTKVGNSDLCKFCDEYGFKHVPIIWESHELPHDFEELKLEADGFSVINPNVRREGLVYRTNENNPRSFKNVSRLYLLKHSGD